MSWQESAACRNAPVNLWFPERHEMATTAKKTCAVCPVRDECLEAHLFEREGIYGGMSPVERAKERRRRRLLTPRPHVDGCGCPAHGGRQTA